MEATNLFWTQIRTPKIKYNWLVEYVWLESAGINNKNFSGSAILGQSKYVMCLF